MKKVVFVIAFAAAALCALSLWWHAKQEHRAGLLTLYGNVDLRQAELAFNNNERISELFVEEGDRVKAGQLLGRLDTSRLSALAAQAQHQVEAQRQAVDRLHHGSRPEEIAQARANVESAEAEAAYSQKQYARLKSLTAKLDGRAVSQQDLQSAEAALAASRARLTVNKKALELQLAGPRQEDIAQAESVLKANEAQLAFAKQQLADAELVSPAGGVIRSRLLEAGEMASAQRPVFSLALSDPKWVRAYVDESDLGHVRPGMRAEVTVDTFPERPLEAWIGFISPVAEFTPKAVQTEELRSSLVYEVRVLVKDPGNILRLGMPATVKLFADHEAPAAVPPDSAAR